MQVLDQMSLSSAPSAKSAGGPGGLSIFNGFADFADFIIRSLRMISVSARLAPTVARRTLGKGLLALDQISRSLTPGKGPERSSDPEIFNNIADFVIRSCRPVAISIGLALIAVTAYVATATPMYTAHTQLLMDTQRPHLFREQFSDARQLQDRYEIQTQIAILVSDNVARIVAKNLNLLPSPVEPSAAGGATVDREVRPIGAAYQGGLEARRARDSYVIEVSYRSHNPETAARFANAFAEAYIEDQLATRASAARQGSQWLEERIDQLRAQMNAAALQAQELKAKRDYRLATKAEAASAASDRHETRAAKPPRNMLEELEATALTYRRIYEAYLQAHTESVLRQSYPLANARVISWATPPLTPSSPRVARSFIAAIAIGALLGLAVVLLREAVRAASRNAREAGHADRSQPHATNTPR